MGSQVMTVGTALWIHPPEEAGGAAFGGESSHQEVAAAPVTADSSVLRLVMDEFVALVKDTPKVWAVNASHEGSVTHVWTYVDSDDRKDRSPVYAAEWNLLRRYPKVEFDFNVALVPVDGEQFEVGKGTYLYKR